MKKNIFNPQDWLEQTSVKPTPTKVESKVHKTTEPLDNIETCITNIENTATDITDNYAHWRDIGFAFADEFGEVGRDYYHRVSRYSTKYNAKDCDEQYDKCLKANGNGITIATFFYLAKQAGVNVFSNNYQKTTPYKKSVKVSVEKEDNAENKALPTFPDAIFNNLPQIVKEAIAVTVSNVERDMMLLGTITTFSACLPNVFGIYDGKKYYSNLYLFVTAPASAGKGRLAQCKNLVLPIHKLKRELASNLKKQYESEMQVYNAQKNKNTNLEKPIKPPESMLFIPANNSTTGVFQLLSDNQGCGLIFETEGDTLAQAFKSDYGNYSDGFRKAFHHETISYYRRTDREYVDIEMPCLTTVLSGTPSQVATLIPNAENGLFSRFIFYYMNITPIWKNVFEITASNGLDSYYQSLGKDFLSLYKTLKRNASIQITLSEKQQIKFNKFFSQIQTKYLSIQTDDYIATVRRMGLVAFRMMMIFTALRIMEDGDVNKIRECQDVDFDNTLAIITVLIQHSRKVFNALPQEIKPPKRNNRKERFLESLPEVFTRQGYLDKATLINLPHKTAEGYITQFVKNGLIHRDAQGKYLNPAKQESKETQEVKGTDKKT